MTQFKEPLSIRACEKGLLPDALVRLAIRQLCKQRLKDENDQDLNARDARLRERLHEWTSGPLAIATNEANEQHYEVPPEFYEQVLGRHLKYSCAYWPDGVDDLDSAEAAMLEITCARAGIKDGMDILELGCGWGSLTLWMANHYPGAFITAVSNSHQQKEWIDAQARERGLNNIHVITTDINDFDIAHKFDRVVSVEMFEHVRNHALLFSRIRQWLKDDGKLFTHVFCHRELAYPFESRGQSDWMSRHFFTGGMMPSFELFLHYQSDLKLEDRWWVDGTHYEKTSNAWLARQDKHSALITSLFEQHYSAQDARIMNQRWRMFFMAVAELFGYQHGQQWGVGHYLFTAK